MTTSLPTCLNLNDRKRATTAKPTAASTITATTAVAAVTTITTRIRLLLVLLLCVVLHQPTQHGYAHAASEDGDDLPNPDLPYFYLGNPNAKSIKEFAVFGENAAKNDWPSFLYDANVDAYRLVEFYAHWCPHCQKFRPNFIAISKTIEQMAQKYDVDLRIYAVSCTPHKHLCRHQNITGYPRIKLFPPHSTTGKFINHYELHPFHVLRMVGVNLDDEMEHQISDELEALQDQEQLKDRKKHGNALLASSPTERYYLPRTKADIYNDAYLSFDYAMRNGIFSTNSNADHGLFNRTKEVFSKWIIQAQGSLPPTWGLQNMVSDIKDNLDFAVESEENLLSIVDKYPPKRKQWSKACSRGDPYAGYTCGLWQLFHIMSIGMVVFNKNIVGDDDWMFFRPEEFGDTLRDYIELFFGCEVCRINFVHAYDSCGLDRCNRLIENVGNSLDWEEFPLWLFETHNAVNTRLLHERAEREHRSVTGEEEISVLWPSRLDCAACWHPDGRWDPEMIVKYLRMTYWPDDDLTTQLRRELREGGIEAEKEFQADEERRFLLHVGVAIVTSAFVVAVYWYRKKAHLKRTGRHKKVEV